MQKSSSSKPASDRPPPIVASELAIPDCFRFLRSGSAEYDVSDLSSVGESDYEIIGREPRAPCTALHGFSRSQSLSGAIPPPDEPTDWRRRTQDALLRQERRAGRIILDIVKTPPADHLLVVDYVEEPANPVSLSQKIQDRLSRNQLIRVRLNDDTEIEVEMEVMFTRFLVSPFEVAAVRDCDSRVDRPMSFEAFMDCYERDKLSISAHTNTGDDMPLFLRHLDHGYTFGWGAHIPGIDTCADRWQQADLLHSSIQIYHSAFIRPYQWRKCAPGHSTAIRVRAGQLVLRLFNYPAPVSVSSRVQYFSVCAAREADTSLCVVVEVAVGEMIIIPPGVMFDIFAPVATMTTTTWFLNYHCFHLSEMAMSLRKRSAIPFVSQCSYYTASRMLCAAKQYEKTPIRDKSLLGLCFIVARPIVYFACQDWPNTENVQKTIDWLFTLDRFGAVAVDGYDIPEGYKYQPRGYEYKSLAVAYRTIKYMEDVGVGIPMPDDEGDSEPVKDYIFGIDAPWTSRGSRLSIEKWKSLIIDSA